MIYLYLLGAKSHFIINWNVHFSLFYNYKTFPLVISFFNYILLFWHRWCKKHWTLHQKFTFWRLGLTYSSSGKLVNKTWKKISSSSSSSSSSRCSNQFVWCNNSLHLYAQKVFWSILLLRSIHHQTVIRSDRHLSLADALHSNTFTLARSFTFQVSSRSWYWITWCMFIQPDYRTCFVHMVSTA